MSWQHPNNMVFFHVLNLSSIDQSFTFFSFPNKLTNVTNFFTEILTSQHPGFQVSRCGVSVRMHFSHMIKKHFTNYGLLQAFSPIASSVTTLN